MKCKELLNGWCHYIPRCYYCIIFLVLIFLFCVFRYRNAFPTLLPTVYSRNWYKFRHTNRQRTQATVRAFADGIFGHNGYQQVVVEPILDPDRLLRPHDGCPLYDAASDNTVQRGLWQNGPEFQAMLNQVCDTFSCDSFCIFLIVSSLQG